LTYIVASALFLLLAVVGFAGCFGIVHYRDYMWLKAENAYLHQKETELDKLQLTLRSIGKDEDAIRNFLGLEGPSLVEGNLGKGGNSFSHPIPITYPDPANNEIPSSIQQHSGSKPTQIPQTTRFHPPSNNTLVPPWTKPKHFKEG
jgi:hypothetical protein